MEKLTILLHVAAVLMSTQALIQEQRQKAKINLFSKRKPSAERWWGDNGCSLWGSCTVDAECCLGNCGGMYCSLLR
uniref:Conotoxin Vc6.15 n=1 Tax=Conus victoriae TaxID=319920 RepID=O26F_CONVC|nr:RecName: Full=Conotoxin Vc6.15; Flags: Precursor [Conus victoriae]AEA35364.1 O-conotoxin Vc6.15 precursor [Conus victoriae]